MINKTFTTKTTLLASAISAVILTGCGGGGGGGTSDYAPPPNTHETSAQQLNGSGVKGPLVNADVKIYRLDPSQPDLKGELLASGTTDENAAISGVALPSSVTDAVGFLEQRFLVEVSGGTEVGSNLAPVIGTLRSVITGQQYSRDFPVYATPLSTFAIELAAKMKQQNPTIDFNTLLNGSGLEINGSVALNAEQTVKAAFGLDRIDNVDLFAAAPLLTSNADPEKVLNYRIALEAFAAILVDLQAAAGGANTNDLIAALAEDLTDGAVDGAAAGGAPVGLLNGIANLITIVTADPDTLNIPNTARPISALADVIFEEAPMTGASTAGKQKPVVGDIKKPLASTKDSDKDGVPDGVDLFPLNPFEAADTDGDCGAIPPLAQQNGKTGSGCGDNSDWAPNDPLVTGYCDAGSLSDGDTGTVIPEATKTDKGCGVDDDGDFVDNYYDKFPKNILEWEDTDQDCSGLLNQETSGNGCGDNSDFDICYEVQIAGNVLIGVDPNAATAHGIGKAMLDTSTGELVAEVFQRALIQDDSNNYAVLADGGIRTTYTVDTNDPANNGTKDQYACENYDPNAVDPCGLLTLNVDTPLAIDGPEVVNNGIAPYQEAGNFGSGGSNTEIRFTSEFVLIVPVLSSHLLTETSRGIGGATVCDMTPPSKTAVKAIPPTFTLP